MTKPRTLDDLLDPAFIADLEARPSEELRAMRDDAVAFETEASYLRRLAQGRIDILVAEQARRERGGDEGLGALIDQLPQILAGAAPRTGPTQSHFPSVLAPDELGRLGERYAGLASDSTLANLPDTDDAELAAALEGHREQEGELSAIRRRLHGVIDAVEAVLARRLSAGVG
jgi:hypothetical protein